MSRNRQGYIHSKNYDFAGFGENGLQILHCKVVPHELSAELKVKRVEICKEMLEVLEEVGPRQKNYIIADNEGSIYWDNYHRKQ
jgi:hypothetical protein